jgi:iron complex outermembrane receptor protein
MRATLKRSSLLATSASILFLAAPAMAQDDDGGLGEIVVTAQRTSQTAQKVPVALTALDSNTLERMQINNAKDLGQVAPNVQITTTTGGSGGIVPFIRGGGVTDGSNITSEPEVGIYIDDVYQPRTSASFIEALDVERVEVLRGPQGTLYGRNSSSGALKIITREPGEEFEGKIELGVGSWDEIYGKMAFSGAVSEDGRLRAGFSGTLREREGGRQYNATLDKKVGAEEFRGFQGQLVFDNDSFKARLKGFYANLESDGLYAVSMDPATLGGSASEIRPTSGSYRTVLSPHDSFTSVRHYGTSLHLSGDISDNAKLVSITAWSKLTDDWSVDFGGGIAGSEYDTPLTGYQRAFANTADSSQTAFSQELQLQGEAFGGLVSYVTGLFYFREAGTQNVHTDMLLTAGNLDMTTDRRFTIETESYAAFGQVSIKPTDRLTINLGGRYTEDHKSMDGRIYNSFGADGLVLRKDKYKDFLPKAGIDYQITPRVMAYASYSEGFKAGGYNGLSDSADQLNTPFGAQKVKAYEIGFKSDFFDRKARLNVSAFFNDYSSIQQQYIDGEGNFQTVNYAAEHKGVEVELNVRPVKGLTLWANGVYNDAEYGEAAGFADLDNTTAVSYAGNDMINMFKHQATFGADLELPVGQGNFVAGANYNIRAGYFSTIDNLTIGQVPATELLAAYVGYEINDWSIRLSGKNLTNQIYYTTGFTFDKVAPRMMADPRTWRLSISKKF